MPLSGMICIVDIAHCATSLCFRIKAGEHEISFWLRKPPRVICSVGRGAFEAGHSYEHINTRRAKLEDDILVTSFWVFPASCALFGARLLGKLLPIERRLRPPLRAQACRHFSSRRFLSAIQSDISLPSIFAAQHIRRRMQRRRHASSADVVAGEIQVAVPVSGWLNRPRYRSDTRCKSTFIDRYLW